MLLPFELSNKQNTLHINNKRFGSKGKINRKKKKNKRWKGDKFINKNVTINNNIAVECIYILRRNKKKQVEEKLHNEKLERRMRLKTKMK